MHPRPRTLGLGSLGLLLACLPCRSEVPTGALEPEAWSTFVHQCVEPNTSERCEAPRGWLRAPTIVRVELVDDWLVVHRDSHIQLLHRHRGEFHELVLDERDVNCVAPAAFAIVETGRRSLDDYIWREFGIVRSVHFVDGAPVIHEHLRVLDFDPRFAAPEPVELVHEAELDRPLELDGRVLRAPAGLWPAAEEGEIDLMPDIFSFTRPRDRGYPETCVGRMRMPHHGGC